MRVGSDLRRIKNRLPTRRQLGEWGPRARALRAASTDDLLLDDSPVHSLDAELVETDGVGEGLAAGLQGEALLVVALEAKSKRKVERTNVESLTVCRQRRAGHLRLFFNFYAMKIAPFCSSVNFTWGSFF